MEKQYKVCDKCHKIIEQGWFETPVFYRFEYRGLNRKEKRMVQLCVDCFNKLFRTDEEDG